MVARQIVGSAVFIAAVWMLLEIAKEAFDWDVDLELNPLSTKFGRAKFGNTNVDLTGGFGGNIRLVVQMLTSSKKRDDGKIIKANPWMTFAFWLKYKGHPSAVAVLNILEGKRFGGKPVTPAGISKDLLVPISIETLWEAVDEHGLRGLLLGIPEMMGDSVQIYEDKEDKKKASGWTPSERTGRYSDTRPSGSTRKSGARPR